MNTYTLPVNVFALVLETAALYLLKGAELFQKSNTSTPAKPSYTQKRISDSVTLLKNRAKLFVIRACQSALEWADRLGDAVMLFGLKLSLSAKCALKALELRASDKPDKHTAGRVLLADLKTIWVYDLTPPEQEPEQEPADAVPTANL